MDQENKLTNLIEYIENKSSNPSNSNNNNPQNNGHNNEITDNDKKF